MQYDSTLFGEKIPIYMDSAKTNIGYAIGTINNTISAGFKSGAMPNNQNLPDSMMYWKIGAKSPYNGYGFAQRQGSSPYTWNVFQYRDEKEIAFFCTAGRGKIDSDMNISDNGTYNTTSANDRFALSQSKFKIADTTTPLWYMNRDVSTPEPVNGYYNPAAIIADFDYNNVILEIYINGNTNLSSYVNNSSNVIREIGYIMHLGQKDITTTIDGVDYKYKLRNTIYSQNYTADGANRIITGGSSYVAGTFYTDHRYPTPDFILDNSYYNLPDFSMIGAINGNTGRVPLFSNTYTSNNNITSISNVSYFRDLDKWDFDNTGWYLKKSDTVNNVYTEDDYNYIRKLIAWLGFWFTDGGTYTDTDTGFTVNRLHTLLGDDANQLPVESAIPNHVYQAEIKKGVTTGNFTELRIAKDNDQSKWGADWREKNGYNGRSSDRNSDRGNLTTTLHRGTIAAGCKWYALNETQLNALITWINSGYQPASNDQFANDFKGVNPSEYITTITYLPIYPIPTGTDEMINIGPLSTSVTGRKIAYEYGVLIDVGSIPLSREYNNFLDYKPYTAVSLYVPFCGTMELDPSNYYGRTINVKLMVDMSTGSCTGLIFANDLLIDSIQGQCGIKIPLAAFNMGSYQDAIINAQYQLKAAERQKEGAIIGLGASMVGGALTAATGIGAVAGAVGSIYSYNKMLDARDKIENIEYNIEHMQPKQTQISTAAPNIAMGFERDCRLIITRPADMIEDPDEFATRIAIYGHTVGYMTNKQGYLSDFHGFTQCSNVDLSGIPLTSSEIASIKESLKKGVYLP